jgi:DNA-binding NarL/FixJ family response regulator
MSQLMVLGVDDDGQARELIAAAARRLAKQLGQPITTHVTASSKDALTLLKAQGPATAMLVVLDIGLPGDMDGCLLGSYIRKHFPQAIVLPFTGDDNPATMHVIQTSGMYAPVFKPTSATRLAERMAEALQTEAPEPDLLLQTYHANVARELSHLLDRDDPPRAVHVAILAQKHVVLAGLKHILSSIGEAVEVTVTVPSGRADPVIVAARQGQVDLLVCDPDDLDPALEIAQRHGLPILVYASLHDAPRALSRGQSVVVEPITPAAWAEAIATVLRGERYRPPHLEALLAMVPRDRGVVKLLRRGMNSTQIGERIGLTKDRVRQRISNLYRQLELPPERSALLAWAQAVPEAWLDELPDR